VNVHPDLSFVTLIVHASVIVQAIIALLALLSLWSWWQIFLKLFQLRRMLRETDAFEDAFWQGGNLETLYRQAGQARVGGGLEHIFTAGFREYSKHRRQGSPSAVTLDAARRAMRAAYQREIDAIEAHLAGLATVGSVSPYIGLFGTVWGIMTSFQAIAASKNTSLAVVAPGIAEALFATAIGLIAAIPATIFYNKFTSEVNRQAQRLEGFADEFSAILSRQIDERA